MSEEKPTKHFWMQRIGTVNGTLGKKIKVLATIAKTLLPNNKTKLLAIIAKSTMHGHWFSEICSIIGAPVNKAAIQHIVRRCPPPTAEKQAVFEAWREARRAAEKHLAAVPKKISFDRRKFAPYLDKLGSDRELENLFLEFLRERVK